MTKLLPALCGFLASFACGFAQTSAPDQSVTPDDPVPSGAAAVSGGTGGALDVLFVGNSYTASAGGQPAIFAAFMGSRGKPCRVEAYVRAGETLEGFVLGDRGDPGGIKFLESKTLERLDEPARAAKLEEIAQERAKTKGKLSEAIAKGPWDAVVLQVWMDALSPEESNFQQHVATLAEMIRQQSRDARIILYMVWASQNDRAKQAVIRESVMQAARANKLGVAPAGLAVWKLKDARKDWGFFRSAQDSHPGYDGGYLVACSLYAAITGEFPVGLPATASLPASYDFPVPVKTPERDQRIAAGCPRHLLGPAPG